MGEWTGKRDSASKAVAIRDRLGVGIQSLLDHV